MPLPLRVLCLEEALEVLTISWQNFTYSHERSLVNPRSFVVCALAKEDDEDLLDDLLDDLLEDQLEDDEIPKVIISSGSNGL
jgi:hypothetical protein